MSLQVIYESVDFPAVTFCNLNSMMQSKVNLGGEDLTNVIDQAKESQIRAMSGTSKGSDNESWVNKQQAHVSSRKKRAPSKYFGLNIIYGKLILKLSSSKYLIENHYQY